jgi:hypothetical protein
MKRKQNTGKIVITAPNNMFVLRLLDDQLWEVAVSAGRELRVSVPQGLYVARCEMGGPSAQKTFRVTPGTTTRVNFLPDDLPGIPTSAPVSGATNEHEYYKEHVKKLSLAESADARWKKKEARLIVMNRRLQENSKVKVSLTGFRLLTTQGEVVTGFARSKSAAGEDNRQRDDNDVGRASLSIDLPAGGYLLEWPPSAAPRGKRIVFPLWIAPGWVTSLFLGVCEGEKHPDPASISLHLGMLHEPDIGGFHAGDTGVNNTQDLVGTATELALASLRTGRRQLADSMLEQLLWDKFVNPMSGILGAYMLCQRDKTNWGLLSHVISRLNELLPGHPDIQGIIAVARNGGWDSTEDPQPIDFPPMLQLGLSAVSDFEWHTKIPLVKEASIAEQASLQNASNGLWTTLLMQVKGSVSSSTSKAKSTPQKNIRGTASRHVKSPKRQDSQSASENPRILRKHSIAKSPKKAKSGWISFQYADNTSKSLIRTSRQSKTSTKGIYVSFLQSDKTSGNQGKGTMLQMRRLGYSVASAENLLTKMQTLGNTPKIQ